MRFPRTGRNTACVLNSGCPEGSIDSARMKAFLRENGWDIISDPREADLVFFRACALTETSQQRSLDIVARLRREKMPTGRLVVWGCLPEIAPIAMRQEYDGITFGERDIDSVNEIVRAAKPIQQVEANWLEPRMTSCDEISGPTFFTSMRGVASLLLGNLYVGISERFDVMKFGPPTFFVKTCTGCLGACTFCAVRKARGVIRSKSIDEVLREFRQGLERGFRYFGLLGTDVGAYGRDRGHTLVDLLNELAREPTDFHIGLRNVNPYYLNEMFEEMQPILSSGKIWFLSSAVESGSDRILGLMGRKYAAGDFRRCIRTINSRYPHIFLTTQIMVGFPGERDEDFQESMHLLDQLKFDWVEVYMFSKRSGTIAASMDEISERVKEVRFRRLLLKSLRHNLPSKVEHMTRSVLRLWA